MSKPIMTTLIFGLLSGFGIIAVGTFTMHLWAWPVVMKGFVLLNLILYSVLLCRWSKTPVTWIVFPLVLATASGLWSDSGVACLLPVLAIFSWIRSGICFNAMPLRSGLGELITISAGSVFLLLHPASSLSLFLAVWFFFLVQTLYFYIVPVRVGKKMVVAADRFESAYREAERLLDCQLP